MSIFVDDASLTIEINKKQLIQCKWASVDEVVLLLFPVFFMTKINLFQEPDTIYWKLDTLHTARIHKFVQTWIQLQNMHIIVMPISSIMWKQVMLLGVTVIKIMLQSTN